MISIDLKHETYQDMNNKTRLWHDRRRIGRCCRPVDKHPDLEAQVIRGTTEAEHRPNYRPLIHSNNNSKAAIISKKRRLAKSKNKIKVNHMSTELDSFRQMAGRQSRLI